MDYRPIPEHVYAYAGLEPYASPKDRLEAMHITMRYQRARDELIDLMVSGEIQIDTVGEYVASVTAEANE